MSKSKNKNKHKKSLKNIKSNIISIILISLSGLLVFVIEEYLYPDAGMQLENKALSFQNHEVYLREQLLNSIENIANSNSFNDIKLTQKREFNKDFLLNVYKHEANLTKTMRILGYYNMLVSDVLLELSEIPDNTLRKIKKNEMDSFLEDSMNLGNLSEKFRSCSKKVEEKKEEITYFLSPKPENLSDEEKVEIYIKIAEFIRSLYHDDCFLVSLDGSSSKSIDEFANSINKTIFHYSSVMQVHQEALITQRNKKNAFIFIALLLTALLVIVKEKKDSETI